MTTFRVPWRDRAWFFSFPESTQLAVITVGAATAVMLWLANRAAVEWTHGAAEAARLRAEAAANRLSTALRRDMQALQLHGLVMMPSPDGCSAVGATRHAVASAFAKYAYAEAFFGWCVEPQQIGEVGLEPVFYVRTERLPTWLHGVSKQPFPVTEIRAPDASGIVLAGVQDAVSLGQRFAVFDLTLDATPYQAVAYIGYSDAMRRYAVRVFGFLVSIPWVKEHYFPAFAEQLDDPADAETGIRLTVRAGDGSHPQDRSGVSALRTLPLQFYDPSIAALRVASETRDSAVAEATVANDQTLRVAHAGAWRVRVVGVVSAVALLASVWLTLRSVRERAQLAELRADFVASVTHELKAPVATVRMIGETFASARGVTADLSRKYGRLTVNEAHRLTRMIDNLLTHSGMSDRLAAYRFESLSVPGLVETILRDFASQLEYGGFHADVTMADDLPLIHGDKIAIRLCLANLIDNAIRYSATGRVLAIRGRRVGAAVEIQIEDRGAGIPPAELPLITKRFFRGSNSVAGGTGLGLAIADRVARDHGGRLAVSSVLGRGTVVAVTFSIEESHS